MLENAIYYAKNLNCRVFMPEYRLMPDYVFPTQLNDCYESLEYVYKEFNINKLILYGESAGGCLAGVIAQKARDENGPNIDGQMLIYPCCDSDGAKYDSMSYYRDARFTDTMNFSMWEMYLKNTKSMKYTSPIECKNLENLPKTYIEPHEIDTLRDEAIAYGKKLQIAKVPTEINLIKGSYHSADSQRDSPYIQKILGYRSKVMDKMFKTE